MAVDISGGEGSLFWEVGVDTNDFDAGMKQLTERIQQATKAQIEIQQQAAQSQKLVAQQILQSAGAIKGVDTGIAAQLRGLTSLQGGIEKIGAEMAQTTNELQTQIQGLQGQTIELKAKGFDTTALETSLEKVAAEVEKIKAAPLDIQAGPVDVEPLLSALRQVQAEYDKLSVEPLQIKIGGVNTASVEKAFEGLQRRFDGLNNTALVLKVKGVDTASLTTAIDKAKADFEALRGLTLSPDMDLTQFQQQYRQLQGSLTALEAEKIQLRAEGVDTSKLERDLKTIRTEMAGMSREALRVQVDGSSLEALESQLQALKKKSLDLDFKGVDTAPVLTALETIEAQIDKIKKKPVEVRSGTVNLGPLSSALLKAGEEIDTLSARPVVVKADASGLGEIAQQADRATNALHGVAEGMEQIGEAGAGQVTQINQQFQQTESLAKKAAVALGAYMSFQAGENFIRDVIRVRGEFQKLQAVLTNSLGADEAGKVFDQLVKLAASTPSQLNELTGAYTKLVNQGIKPTMAEMQALSDVSAATGKGFDQLAEAIIDAQTGEFERLKEFGVRAEKAGDQVKFTFKGVETQVAFTSEAIKDYIVGLGKVEGVTGASAAIMGTLEGQISNLADAWDRMLNSIGESNQGLLSGGISGLTTLVEHYQEVLDILTVLVAMYGTYKAVQLADIALKKVATVESVKFALAQKGIDVATKGATAAQVLQTGAATVARGAWQALNITMKANPAVYVAGIIGTLASALILFNRVTKESAVVMNEYNAELDKEQQALNGMFEAAKGAAEGTQQRAEAIKAINENYKDYLPQLLTEKTTNEQLADTYKLLNARIAENMALRFKSKNIEDLNAKFGERNTDIFNNIIGGITKNLGAAQAGQAAAELNKLGDSLATVLDKIDNLERRDTQEAVKLFEQRNSLVDAYMKKFQLLPKHFNAILEFAGNKNGLRKGLDNIDAFWKEIIKGNQKGADATAKTLADYLKEKNFAAAFEQAFPLAQSKEDLDKVLQKLTSEKGSLNRSDKNFEQQVNYYQGLINRVNKEIERFDPNKLAKKNAAAADALEKQESKMNALLRAREDLLQAIADKRAQAEADTHGKQVSAVEKINQKYQALIDKVDEFNRKAGEWNKDPKNKNNQVTLLGVDATRMISEARALEISQELMEQDVKNYAASLKEKSDLFKRYQDTVQEVGRRDADKLYDDEKLAFASYLDYLKFELAKFGTKISMGVELNFADKEKLKLLAEDFKKVSQEQADQQIEDTKRVMVATLNAAEQRKIVEANYQKQVDILRKTYSGKELEDRERVLKQALDEDLRALAQHLGEQTGMYRAMNRDIYKLANERIDNEIKLLEAQLEGIKDADPGLAAAIKEAIKRWRELQNHMNGSLTTFEKIDQMATTVSNGFGDLAAAVGDMNEGLAASLQLVADLSAGIGKAAKSYQTFKDAQNMVDPNTGKMTMQGVMGSISGSLGIFSALVSIIQTVDNIGRKRREADRQFRQEQEESLGRIQAGEAEINALYRERAREQVLLNKLRIEGLVAEKRLLEEQAKQVTEQYMRIYDLLKGINPLDALNTTGMTQQEVADLIKQMGGQNGTLGSLANLTFEKLEELYIQNILTGRAKELFETLQKLKAEGADIDRMLQDAKQATQELFTGTTAEGIADVIADGFAAGKRSVADFADSTEEIIRKALQNAFRYQFLEKEINKLYEQFAADAQSGGSLDKEEIQRFTDSINKTIKDSALFVEQIEKATGISLSDAARQAGGSNSLQGAIRGITEQQAELLAGQFGGLRLTALEHLKVAQTSLSELTRIQQNTAATVQNTANSVKHLAEAVRVLTGSASGNNPLHVKVK